MAGGRDRCCSPGAHCPHCLATQPVLLLSSVQLLLGLGFPAVDSHLLCFILPQDKEAKSGKVEEKEGRESCDLKGQEDLGGNEADSKDEDSETDYSSGDEEVLTKAGRPVLKCGNGRKQMGCRHLASVGAALSPCSDGMLSPCSDGMPCSWFSLPLPLCRVLILCRQLLLSSSSAPYSVGSSTTHLLGAIHPCSGGFNEYFDRIH